MWQVSCQHSRKQVVAHIQGPAPSPAVSLVEIMKETDSKMMAVAPCSNTDKYFAESMIPHHQVGAPSAALERDLCEGVLFIANIRLYVHFSLCRT